jgi:hypothetical protein
VTIARRSAIQPQVIVVSARSRRAIFGFSPSAFRRRSNSPALQPRRGAGFDEGLQKATTIRVILKNRLAPVAAIQEVTDREGIFHSELACHDVSFVVGPKVCQSRKCSICRTDPFMPSGSKAQSILYVRHRKPDDQDDADAQQAKSSLLIGMPVNPHFE